VHGLSQRDLSAEHSRAPGRRPFKPPCVPLRNIGTGPTGCGTVKASTSASGTENAVGLAGVPGHIKRTSSCGAALATDEMGSDRSRSCTGRATRAAAVIDGIDRAERSLIDDEKVPDKLCTPSASKRSSRPAGAIRR